MAVKLYEKDPSKLTAMDEPRPNLATNSDISDDEESSNQAVDVDVKEEPVDVVSVDENPPPLVPDSQAVFAATAFPTPHLRERHSFSSGQDEPSTDSDTVRQRKKSLAVDNIHTTSHSGQRSCFKTGAHEDLANFQLCRAVQVSVTSPVLPTATDPAAATTVLWLPHLQSCPT